MTTIRVLRGRGFVGLSWQSGRSIEEGFARLHCDNLRGRYDIPCSRFVPRRRSVSSWCRGVVWRGGCGFVV